MVDLYTANDGSNIVLTDEQFKMLSGQIQNVVMGQIKTDAVRTIGSEMRELGIDIASKFMRQLESELYADIATHKREILAQVEDDRLKILDTVSKTVSDYLFQGKGLNRIIDDVVVSVKSDNRKACNEIKKVFSDAREAAATDARKLIDSERVSIESEAQKIAGNIARKAMAAALERHGNRLTDQGSRKNNS